MDIGENSKPKRQVVFVDPDDPDAPYWWPAMVVPPEDFTSFQEIVSNEVQKPGSGQLLVCYFEDGSFSLVGEHECVPFSTDTHPYIDYLKGPHGRQFHKDKAVRSATLYCSTAVPPPSFTWIRDEEAKKERIEAAAKYAGVQKSFTVTAAAAAAAVPSSSSAPSSSISAASQAQKRSDHHIQHHNFVGKDRKKVKKEHLRKGLIGGGGGGAAALGGNQSKSSNQHSRRTLAEDQKRRTLNRNTNNTAIAAAAAGKIPGGEDGGGGEVGVNGRLLRTLGVCGECNELSTMRIVKTLCPGCVDLLDRVVLGTSCWTRLTYQDQTPAAATPAGVVESDEDSTAANDYRVQIGLTSGISGECQQMPDNLDTTTRVNGLAINGIIPMSLSEYYLLTCSNFPIGT